MLRAFFRNLAAAVLVAHLGGWSCYYDDDCCHDHDHNHFEENVLVEITGDSGTDFDAFFEDDNHVDSFSNTVPFSAVFNNREEFFTAVVDKDSSGPEAICVRVSTDHSSHQECTGLPFGRVTVTIVF